MTGFRGLVNLLNERPLRAEAASEGKNRDVMRLLGQCGLRKHWPSVLVVILAGSVGGLIAYVYAWAGRVVADDIVQVQLTAANNQVMDSTVPGETQRFDLDDDAVRTTLSERMTVKQGRSDREKLRMLGRLALVLILLEICRHLIQFIANERKIYLGTSIQFRLRPKIYGKLLQLPVSYHDRHSPGRLLTHLFSDLMVIQHHMVGLIQSLPTNLLAMFVGIVIVLVIDVQMAWLVLIALPAYAVVYRWFRSRLNVVHRNLREREGHLNGHIANRISQFLLVKSFVNEQREAIDFVRQAKPIVQNHVAASLLGTSFRALCAIVTGLSMTAVLWLGTQRVRNGDMTLGELLMFYASAGYLFAPVTSLISLASVLPRLRTVSARVMHVLDEPIATTDPRDPLPVPTEACEVRFDHVTMAYEQGHDPALHDVSFTLPSGQRLCVMGPSGSGKTSLAKLVGRLYEPTEGRVCFDGIDVRQFKLTDLRRLVGMVTQEPIIFSGTIENNIRYGSDHAPPHAVTDAARYAQLHDFIDQLPRRYSTLTYERGLTLSGGEKQRLNLARALLYDPKVLVLDDCTSALDAHTEAKLIDAFHTMLSGRTTLLVSHRVSIAMKCDLVLILDKGRVVEFGSPGQLLKGGGPFAVLHREQRGNLNVA